jgi:2,4-dichlorophenol 6-monooxygenase
VELNQHYTSSAVVPYGTAELEYRRDRELYYQATTWPGAHLPHARVGQRKFSSIRAASRV